MALEDAWSILKNAPAPEWTRAQNQVQESSDGTHSVWQANTYPIQGAHAQGKYDFSNVSDPNQYTHSAPVDDRNWPAPAPEDTAPAGDWSSGGAVAQGNAPVAEIKSNTALDNMESRREMERMAARANAIKNEKAAMKKPGFFANLFGTNEKARDDYQREQEALAQQGKAAMSRAAAHRGDIGRGGYSRTGGRYPGETRLIQRQPRPDVGVTSTSLFADNPLGPLAGDRT